LYRSRTHVWVTDEHGGCYADSTKLYPDPIHRVYNLGYDLDKDPFPNATYFSRQLILIPTHPMMNIEKLSIIVNIIKTRLGE